MVSQWTFLVCNLDHDHEPLVKVSSVVYFSRKDNAHVHIHVFQKIGNTMRLDMAECFCYF